MYNTTILPSANATAFPIPLLAPVTTAIGLAGISFFFFAIIDITPFLLNVLRNVEKGDDDNDDVWDVT